MMLATPFTPRMTRSGSAGAAVMRRRELAS